MPFTRLIAIFLALTASTAVTFAQLSVNGAHGTSPVGRWYTIDDTDGKPRGVVEIVEKDGALEGRIVGTLRAGESLDRMCDVCPGDRKGKKFMGLLLFSDLKKEAKNGQAVWSGGEILDPDNGKLYRVKVELENGGAVLKVRGFIGISLLGRTQIWQRAPM